MKTLFLILTLSMLASCGGGSAGSGTQARSEVVINSQTLDELADRLSSRKKLTHGELMLELYRYAGARTPGYLDVLDQKLTINCDQDKCLVEKKEK